MVIYLVHCSLSKDLSKGKGKALKDQSTIIFSVLCRNNKDAIKCLEYVYWNDYYIKFNRPPFTLDDFEIKLSRQKIDSRGFNANWLLMDDMSEPLYLPDICSSLAKLKCSY